MTYMNSYGYYEPLKSERNPQHGFSLHMEVHFTSIQSTFLINYIPNV